MNSYLEKDFELLQSADSELFEAFQKEQVRQSRNIELIASENYTSAAVMAASGSILTNKYAEGYPSRRYYGGCEYVDIAESLAIERAKKLFGCEFANVQPHSGSQANFAVYFALLILFRGMSENELRAMPKGYLLVKAAKKCKLMK